MNAAKSEQAIARVKADSENLPGTRSVSSQGVGNSSQLEGKAEVNGWKWIGDPKVQICIIAALFFVIWMALLQQYY